MSLITVIGRGHSGTRALSHTLSESGVFMGTPLNPSGDLLPAEPMYEACRLFARYVDWDGTTWRWDRALAAEPTAEFTDLIHAYLASVLQSQAPHKGWKIPETTLCFPWIVRLFPDAHYVFWIRDPRDCILGAHVTDDLRDFHVPAPTTPTPQHRRALSWQYQYELVQATPKPRRWIEVRFEDFVLRQNETLTRLETFLDMPLTRIPVRPESVGRWQRPTDSPAHAPSEFPCFEEALQRYGYRNTAVV